MVDTFKLAKEWLYQEIGCHDEINLKMLNTLTCLLDEAYSYGYDDAYAEGYKDGHNDTLNFVKECW